MVSMAVSRKPSKTVSLPWLNKGKETALGQVPVKGDQRLEMLRQEGADIVAHDYQTFMCHLRGSILATRQAITEIGLIEARKQWMIVYGQYENLRWDEESFIASLDVALRDYVFQPLKVTTEKEALDAIAAEAKRLNKERTVAFNKRRNEWQQDTRLEEVYWMLWRAEPHPSFMPDPNVVPTEKSIQDAKEYIANFLDDNSYLAFISAQRGVVPLKADLKALASNLTEEMVQGKAQPTSKP